jgi:hypothetical protein
MELASQPVIGIGALVLGLAMVWFGMPKKAEIPRFHLNSNDLITTGTTLVSSMTLPMST